MPALIIGSFCIFIFTCVVVVACIIFIPRSKNSNQQANVASPQHENKDIGVKETNQREKTHVDQKGNQQENKHIDQKGTNQGQSSDHPNSDPPPPEEKAPPRQMDQHVLTLVKQLKDPDESVRLKAAKALGKLGVDGKLAIPALEEASKDKDEDVRTVAQKSLAAIREALVQNGNDNGGLPDKLATLVRDLKDPSVVKRKQAIENIGAMGANGIGASEALIQLLVDETVTDVQHAALDALEKINPVLHEPVFIILIEKNPRTKYQAVAKLGELGEAARPAMPLLVTLYEKPKPEQFALYGDYNNALAQHLAVLLAIKKIDKEGKVFNELLLKAVSSPAIDTNEFTYPVENQYRLQIIKMIVPAIKENKLDPRLATKALISVIQSSPATNRQQSAIQELGLIGPDAKEAIPVLMKLKFDPDMMTREAAITALKKIQ